MVFPLVESRLLEITYGMSNKIENWIEDRLINISEGLLCIFVWVVGLALIVGTMIAFFGQAFRWLVHGNLPSRDGFWLYSLVECGENWCRRESLYPTDWVGVNRIINWIMDIHVAFYAIFIGYFAFAAAEAWAESLGNWKALEATLRAPPPPLDDDEP